MKNDLKSQAHCDTCCLTALFENAADDEHLHPHSLSVRVTLQIRKQHVNINQLTPEVAPDAATGEIPNRLPCTVSGSPQTINPDLVPRCPVTVSVS